MNIAISGMNIEITEALREKVYRSLERLEKVVDPNTRIAVEIGKTTNHHKQGDVYKAEGKVVEPKAEYFADIITSNLYSSIDTLADELFEQITRSKARHRVLMRKGQSIIKKLLRLS